MGKFTLLGIRYDNPQQIDQSTLNWEKDLILTEWQPGYGWFRKPQPGTYDANPPQATPVLFGKQPPPLSAGGIQIPNSSTTINNPA